MEQDPTADQVATSKAISMPVRGERAAPIFNKTRPKELIRYFTDLELLFPRAKVTADNEKKRFTVYYVEFEMEQTWSMFPEFRDVGSTYDNLKNTILVHYPDATGDYVYSIRDMDSLIGEQQRVGIKMTNELSEFHLKFLTITTWLIDKAQLGDLEQKRAYLRAFQPSLLSAVKNRLQLKFPNQHPNIPLDIQHVYEAARFVLQSSAHTIQSYFSPLPAPIILQRPSSESSSKQTTSKSEPSIKQENYATLLAEINKTITDLMSGNNRPSRPA